MGIEGLSHVLSKAIEVLPQLGESQCEAPLQTPFGLVLNCFAKR